MLASPDHVANSDTAPRMFAWADTHTLIIFANPTAERRAPGASYSYDIDTKSLTP